MNTWLKKLSPRELGLLIGGITVLISFGCYAFIYMPIIEEQKHLDAAIENQQQLKTFLQSISTEAATLRQNQVEMPTMDPSQTPIGIINASSEQLGIKSSIKRIVPDEQQGITLWLEQCDFDKLIYWLAALNQKHAITVKEIHISRDQGGDGRVSGKILLGS